MGFTQQAYDLVKRTELSDAEERTIIQQNALLQGAHIERLCQTFKNCAAMAIAASLVEVAPDPTTTHTHSPTITSLLQMATVDILKTLHVVLQRLHTTKS